jgi:hypothetical protein
MPQQLVEDCYFRGELLTSKLQRKYRLYNHASASCGLPHATARGNLKQRGDFLARNLKKNQAQGELCVPLGLDFTS